MNISQIKNNQVKTYGLMAVAVLVVALVVGTPSVKGHADTVVGIQPASQMIATGGSESANYDFLNDSLTLESRSISGAAVYKDNTLGILLYVNQYGVVSFTA